jgi:hypothetical protein
VLTLLGAASCGGKPFESALPATTTTTAEITVPPTPTSVTSPPNTNPRLAAHVISAPAGYQISTLSGSHNGPISRADFNQEVGMSDAADSLGFIEGYERSFDRDDYSDGFDITVMHLTSAFDVESFTATAQASIDSSENPKVHPYRGIPGAVEADGTKASSDGAWDYVVAAPKGAWLMIVEYNNDTGGPFPTTMRSVVTSEYALI